jgi:hypothetical protein
MHIGFFDFAKIIFGLYGFKPRSKPVKGMIKAHEELYLALPRKMKLGVHCKDSKRGDLVELSSI